MENNFKKFFRSLGLSKNDKSVLAVDFGSSSVKVIQMKKDKGRIILETYGELAVGPYSGQAVGQAVILPSDKMIEVVTDVVKESNITATNGAIAIPLRSSLLLNLDIPEAGRSNLDEIIPLEARKYIPVPISEVALDWWVVPEIKDSQSAMVPKETGLKKLEVLVVAIHKDTLNLYNGLSEKLKLNLNLVEIETFSAIRAVMRNDLSPTVVLDLGAGSSKVAIVDYGVIRTSHTISKGSQDITLAISRSLEVPFEKAEEIKRKAGLVEQIDDGHIRDSISSILEYIFLETNKVMSNYQKKNSRAISKVVIIGGGALLKGVFDLAVNSFEVPVSLGTPFDKVEYPAFLENVLKEAGPVFAVSIGIALRKLEDI